MKNADQDSHIDSRQLSDPHIITDVVTELLEKLEAEGREMRYISPDILPEIDLYMDQVTSFMDTHLESTKRYENDKILTKTMINNYAKNDLIPPPVRKKYSKDHMMLLILIYYLKSMLSMNDIHSLLSLLRDHCRTDSDTDLKLKDIYREIFDNAKQIHGPLIEDILSVHDMTRDCFSFADPSQQEALQDFTFVAMLCYDIFVKKQLVEQIVDRMNSRMTPPETEEKKKKKEPRRKAVPESEA